MSENLEKKLRNKANSLLSRRAYSREDLRRKLLGVAVAPAVEAVLEQLEQLDLLNDAVYAYNFAFYKVHREGWGPGKIRNALTLHGVKPSDIEKALVKVRDEFGEDYGLSDYLIRYWGKRGEPRNSKSVQRLIEHLLRRGHPRSSILRNLKRMLPPETMQYFGTGD